MRSRLLQVLSHSSGRAYDTTWLKESYCVTSESSLFLPWRWSQLYKGQPLCPARHLISLTIPLHAHSNLILINSSFKFNLVLKIFNFPCRTSQSLFSAYITIFSKVFVELRVTGFLLSSTSLQHPLCLLDSLERHRILMTTSMPVTTTNVNIQTLGFGANA